MVKHAHAKKIELNHQWKNSNSISPPRASVMVALQIHPCIYHSAHVMSTLYLRLGLMCSRCSKLAQFASSSMHVLQTQNMSLTVTDLRNRTMHA